MRTLNFQIHDKIDDDKFNELKEDLSDKAKVKHVSSTSDRSKIDKYLLSVTIERDPKDIIQHVANYVDENLIKLIIPCDDGDIHITDRIDKNKIDEIMETLEKRDC